MPNGINATSAMSFWTFEDIWSQPAIYFGLKPWMIFLYVDGFVYLKWKDEVYGDEKYALKDGLFDYRFHWEN